jgi:glucosylceramidase
MRYYQTLTRLRTVLIISLVTVIIFVFFPFQMEPGGPEVRVWSTNSNQSFSEHLPIHFTPDTRIASHVLPTIEVDEQKQFQEIAGFGAAMTDTSAWLIGTKMSQDQRNSVMRALFDPREGIGLSVLRLPIGASDFTASGMYSYADQQDPSLKGFSIAHDEAYIIPLLKQAIKLNPKLKIIASPWSPPAWMKTNESMVGTFNGKVGTLDPTMYGVYAKYLVKFIQAYEERSVPIYALTVQNEPFSPVSTYPGMLFSARQEAHFIGSYLGPALESAHLSTKILVYDQNWDGANYPLEILEDQVAQLYVDGIAWHGYHGDPSVMENIQEKYPTIEQYITESSPGIAPWSPGQLIAKTMGYGVKGVMLWNLALDSQGGPKIGIGCNHCTGLVTINQQTGSFSLTRDYYELAQVSKAVDPGSHRIASTKPADLDMVAFKTTDGSKVVVVYNDSASSRFLKIRWRIQSLNYLVPNRVTTFKWK